MEPAYVYEYAPVESNEEYREQITEFLTQIQPLVAEYKDESYLKYALVSDNFVVKFLRARKYKVEDAVTLFREALEHRKKFDLDHILDKPDPVVRFLATRYPHAFVGYEVGGRPLYVESIGDIDAAAMTEDTSFDELLHYHRWMQEFLHRKVISRGNYLLAKTALSNNDTTKRTQIDQMVFITNIGSATYAAMKSVDYLKAIAKEDSIGYPEMLYKTWIINAGFIFKAGYAIARPFLDAGTTAKFNIFRSNALTEMTEELGAENLPTFLLGTLKPTKLINFKYFASAEEMTASAKLLEEEKKNIKKLKKKGEYVEPEPEVKYKLPDYEVIPYDEADPRVIELQKRSEDYYEDKSMWMRMTSDYTEEVLFCSDNGLEAYEAKFESDTASLRAKARSGDALNQVYKITYDEVIATFQPKAATEEATTTTVAATEEPAATEEAPKVETADVPEVAPEAEVAIVEASETA